MGRIGIWEIALIVGVIVLLFGAKKIPEIARAVGKAIREFRKAGSDLEGDANKPVEDKSHESES